MPKNAGESQSKSKMRLQSLRKPLRDVSNAKTANKSASNYNKISKDDGGQAGGDSLDRLLLVHSELRRQIDELVAEALKLKGNDRRDEIKQFAETLSDMQTSLKPWFSIFQKAVLSQSIVLENNTSAQPVETKALVSKESTNTAAESPEETKFESLVSPSPLVSWRAGCNTESGRQLFLLTPMPQKKAFSSKHHVSSLHEVEKIPLDEAAHLVSLSDAVRNLGNDLNGGLSAKPTPKVALDTEKTKAVVDKPVTDCATPEKASTTKYSLFVMTPCMKMSPPKSCILLESVSAFPRKKIQAVHKSTPFPTRVHSFTDSQDSESSSDQSSGDLKLKYPELYGIRKENTQKKMAAEDSPNWIVSPPKTCAVMDPSNEPSFKNESNHCLPSKTSVVSNQVAHFPTMKTKECQGSHATTSKSKLQDVTRTLDLAEVTPMMKAPMSSMRMGKHPGENTLKKELWMKFEAASSLVRFNGSLVQDSTKKGFLDILDEVSDA
ncbi:hypothetical protein SASPL_106985 [Salvia splendens]|uniref:Uncharacterized protein n=1 Tax=Salvia splendens TaxID=180675 RepID=A0A8X8YA95_SALSN|nr:uncharacterized protein LOC121794260 [Salvia splendens]KAG6428946.1 hypothetical protein SASPL_106985 [Salvia splendens]